MACEPGTAGANELASLSRHAPLFTKTTARVPDPPYLHQRFLGVLQLRAQIRGDLRLLRRPGLGLAPGLLPDDAGRSPVPPRDVAGS